MRRAAAGATDVRNAPDEQQARLASELRGTSERVGADGEALGDFATNANSDLRTFGQVRREII